MAEEANSALGGDVFGQRSDECGAGEGGLSRWIFFFFFNGKENASARQIDAISTGVLRFFLFIVDGKFAISARQTRHIRHKLASGPKELLLSLLNLCLLSSGPHPPFPFVFLSIGFLFSSRFCH